MHHYDKETPHIKQMIDLFNHLNDLFFENEDTSIHNDTRSIELISES